MSDDIAARRLGRRGFLLIGGGVVVGGALSACSSNGSGGTTTIPSTTATAEVFPGAQAGTLPIPPLLAPELQDGTKVFRLALQAGTSQFIPGAATDTFGANGPYLGPTLRASLGDPVQVHVTNQLGETTTIHWHGMHLPAAMDGGPMQTIDDGATWSPSFTIKQAATTLWYHPHMMGQTLRQVGMGLAGLFILDEDTPAQKALPHSYGVDDIPLILQTQTFDGDDQFVLDGDDDDGGNGGSTTTLVNGAISPVLNTAAARVRLRVLNASSRAIYYLGLADGGAFYQVGSDGGLLAAPDEVTQFRLAPAERAEIVIDIPANGSVELQSRAVGGGGDNDNDAPTGTLLTINRSGTGSGSGAGGGATAPALPASLATIENISPDSATQTREFVLAGGDRDPTINGMSMTSMSDLMDMSNVLQVGLGTVEIWNLVNRSRDTHAFHVHDVQFHILTRDDQAPEANERGRKDTVVVRPGETVSIIMLFEDYADAETPYMYHCHLLNHEDNGMMGQFVVV